MSLWKLLTKIIKYTYLVYSPVLEGLFILGNWFSDICHVMRRLVCHRCFDVSQVMRKLAFEYGTSKATNQLQILQVGHVNIVFNY